MSRKKKNKVNNSSQAGFTPFNPAAISYSDAIQYAATMQQATAQIPAAIRNQIEKGWKQLPNTEPVRSPKSWFFDPLSIQYSIGYKDRKFSLSYDVMKRVVSQLSILSAIINTRIAQVAAFSEPYRKTKSLGFVIKHKDPDHPTSPAEIAFIKELEQFVANCGRPEKNPYSKIARDDFETFIRKIVRDTLQYDAVAVEVIPDMMGIPYEFIAVDASTIRIADEGCRDFEESMHARQGWVPETPAFPNLGNDNMATADGGPISYIQLINGQKQTVYSSAELMYGVRNPRTDIYSAGYGFGEIEQLITIITAYLNAEEYNRRIFTNGSMQKGILNFKGDSFSPEQLEAFKRMWASQVQGVENCIAGNTVIWTSEGAKPIKDIVGDLKEKEIKIWTGASWESALAYKTKEPKIICHTKTSNGLILSTSPDHKFRVIGDSGEPEWRVQKDLKVGDCVLVNNKSIELPSSSNIPVFNSKKLTPAMMETLGWLTGDGYIGYKGKAKSINLFYHHDKEPWIRARHFNILNDFGINVISKDKVVTPEQQEYIKEYYGFKSVAPIRLSLQVHTAEFIDFLIESGFSPSKDGKVIPAWIFTAPKEYKTAFLRGLFSADGTCMSGRSPCLSITNYELRNQVKLLLLSLGIRTSLSEGKTKIVISGSARSSVEAESYLKVKDRDLFFSEIGFLQPHKQPKSVKKVNELNKMSGISLNTVNRYAKLVATKDLVDKKLSKRERFDLLSIIRGTDGCSLPRLIRFMNLVNLEVPSWMENHHFEFVTETVNTGILTPMYDISVYDNEHAFVASGLVVHNSFRTPILQSEGIEWIDLQKTNIDMEYGKWVEYLIKICAGVFLIDPAEINFALQGGVSQTPLFESSQEWKLKASRDKGLKPLLKFIAKLINKNIIDRIDDHFSFEFIGLDELSQQEQHQMVVEQIGSYMTLNEARRSMDFAELPHGDIPMNPTYIQYVLKQQEMEQATQMQGAQGNPGLTGPPGAQDPNAAPIEDPGPMYSGNFGKPAGQ